MFEYFEDILINSNLKLEIDTNNVMNLKITMSYYNSDRININKNIDLSIPFESDIKYNKNIKLLINRDAKIIIDEPFDGFFYKNSNLNYICEEFCWFTIPAGYNSVNGLSDIKINVKRGVDIG